MLVAVQHRRMGTQITLHSMAQDGGRTVTDRRNQKHKGAIGGAVLQAPQHMCRQRGDFKPMTAQMSAAQARRMRAGRPRPLPSHSPGSAHMRASTVALCTLLRCLPRSCSRSRYSSSMAAGVVMSTALRRWNCAKYKHSKRGRGAQKIHQLRTGVAAAAFRAVAAVAPGGDSLTEGKSCGQTACDGCSGLKRGLLATLLR